MKGKDDKSVREQVKKLKVGQSVTFPLDRINLRSARTTACDTGVEINGKISCHLDSANRTVKFVRTK